jgi:hypothetical protein
MEAEEMVVVRENERCIGANGEGGRRLIIDPWRRRAFAGWPVGGYKTQKKFLEVPGTEIRIALADVFRELDDAEIVPER